MPRGGQHITVPTIVGETYEQRSAVERAMQDLRHQRLIDEDLLRRINDMGPNPVSGRLRRRLKDVRAQLGSPAALTEYYILAMKIVATREQAAAPPSRRTQASEHPPVCWLCARQGGRRGQR